jgi:putative transposase
MNKPQTASAMEKFLIIRPYLEEDVPLSKLADYHGLSLSTLKRWVKSYRDEGLAGLERTKRSDTGARRSLTPELEHLTEALLLKKPPLSVAAIHRKVVEVARSKKVTEPSYRVIWDIVRNVDPALVRLARDGNKAYNQEYELVIRREATAPNEIWQADHTPLDIVLIDQKGLPRKPWLTIIIDDFSRVICGYYLSFDAPCAINTALALRQAIWKKKDSKWQVCGIPDVLYSDNGSDFKSEHIEQVAADLKIQLKNSIPGRPQGRGRVERFFGTVNQLLLMNLSSYAPPGTPAPEAVLTLEEFTPLFERFVIDEDHQRIHSSIGVAPIERWVNNGFLPRLPDSLEQLDILLLTVAKTRKVRRDGIHFQALIYIEPTLAAYVGEEVTIRYDPRDLAEIRVYHNDAFLCRAICHELAGQSVSLKEIIKARQKRKRALGRTIAKRKALMDTLLEKPVAKTNGTETDKSKSDDTPTHGLKRYRNE